MFLKWTAKASEIGILRNIMLSAIAVDTRGPLQPPWSHENFGYAEHECCIAAPTADGGMRRE